MKNLELEKKIRGLLIGGAVGDAMGMPTECWSQNQIRAAFPNGLSTFIDSDETDVLGRTMKAGSVTDDTINTVMILNSIVEQKGHLTAEHYVNKLKEWNDHSGVSEYVSGPSTLKALKKIENGIPLEKTGREGTTNGASMRIAPIGIVSDYKKMDELVEKVYQICLPTHNTTIAISGASAVAACVSYVLSGGTSVDDIWDIAFKAVDASKHKGWDYPSSSLKFRMEYAKNIVRNEKKEDAIKMIYEQLGTSVETIETIPAVFAVIDLAQGNPMEAAKIGANIGWDTDTIGAISAGICGGMHPEFDEETINLLENVNDLNFDALAKSILPYSPYFLS
jgi:ADP-ribosylglycohydrolase